MKHILAFVLLTLSSACSSDPQPSAPPAPAVPPPSSARTLPIPNVGANRLPPDHPPVGTTEAQPGRAVTWDVPAGWIEEPPANNVRLAQYRVPGPGGDAECIVFYFGPGQGGDPMANAERWAGQFSQPDGRPSVELMKVETLPGARSSARLVEVAGTYDGGMSGAGAQPGSMLLGGIAEGPDAPWFFKFVGPEATVRAARPAFVRMMESVRANG